MPCETGPGWAAAAEGVGGGLCLVLPLPSSVCLHKKAGVEICGLGVVAEGPPPLIVLQQPSVAELPLDVRKPTLWGRVAERSTH